MPLSGTLISLGYVQPKASHRQSLCFSTSSDPWQLRCQNHLRQRPVLLSFSDGHPGDLRQRDRGHLGASSFQDGFACRRNFRQEVVAVES